MAERRERLKSLVQLQHKLKAMHELRHAGFASAAIRAGDDAGQMMRQANEVDSLATMFPEVYARGIGKALDRKAENEALAAREAANVARETARADRIGQHYREAVREEERAEADKAMLETILRLKG